MNVFLIWTLILKFSFILLWLTSQTWSRQTENLPATYIHIDCRFLAVAVLGKAPKAGSIPDWPKYLPALKCNPQCHHNSPACQKLFVHPKKSSIHKNSTSQPVSSLPFFIVLHYFSLHSSRNYISKDNPMRPFTWSCCPHIIPGGHCFAIGFSIFVSRVDKSG